MALVLAKCKQLDLSHLEDLIEGELNRAERDLPHDEGKIPVVQPAQTLVLENIHATFQHP